MIFYLKYILRYVQIYYNCLKKKITFLLQTLKKVSQNVIIITDCQIVGELSTMIFPQANQRKIELEPTKNVFCFRIFKEKLVMNYKWALYKRNQIGKQLQIETAIINLSAQLEQFLKFVKKQKQNQESITRSKLYDSKALSNSSKINQSSIRTTQKSSNIRKSLLNSSNNGDLQSFQQQRGIKYLKPLTSKFAKQGVELHYYFCISNSQQDIIDMIKEYYLETKLEIVSKSFKNKEQLGKDFNFLETEQKDIRKLSDIKQQNIEISNKTIRQSNCARSTQKSNPLQKKSQIQLQLIQPPKSNNFLLQIKKQQQPQQQINQGTKNLESNASGAKSQQNQGQKTKNSESSLKAKTQINQKKLTGQSVELKNVNANNLEQRQQILFKTQKMLKQQPSQLQYSHDLDLIQTSPVSPNVTHKEVSVKISANDTSFLKLDDVILNDKRVSVSDKSQWMKTSKSRTQDYEITEKSHQGRQKNTKGQNKESRNDLELNSKKNYKQKASEITLYKKEDDFKSLDIISQNPKLTIQYEESFDINEKDQIAYSQKKQSENRVTFKLNKLKRKSTAEQFKMPNSLQDLASHKPKTMEQATIQKNLQKLEQLRIQSFEHQSQQSVSEPPGTPHFSSNHLKLNYNDKFHEKKFSSEKIPSIIPQQNQVAKQNAQTSRQTSNNDSNKYLNQNIGQFDWGTGLEQIPEDEKNKSTPQSQFFSKANIQRQLHKVKLVSQPYIQFVKTKLEFNEYSRRSYQFVRQHKVKAKYFLLVIFIFIFFWIGWNLFKGALNETKTRKIEKNDEIFKKKSTKKRIK